MKENELIDLEIDKLSPEGRGLSKYEDKRVFVIDALPGEKVQARVLAVKKNMATAKTEKILKASPDRVKDDNAQWARVGFARLANLKYDKQVEFKHDRLVNLLKKAGLNDIKVEDAIASPEQVAYRNEVIIPVREVNGQLELGFVNPRTHKFTVLNQFFMAKPEVAEVLLGVRDILRDLKVPAYNPSTNEGFVRHIEVQRSETTKAIVVILVCRHQDSFALPNIPGTIMENLQNVKGVILNYNPHKTERIYGKTDIPLWGDTSIHEKINDIDVEISSRSPFEGNTSQIPNLLKLIKDKGQFQKEDRVIVTHGGVGIIPLSIARDVKQVTGIEVVPASVQVARNNAKNNKIDNFKVMHGSSEQMLARLAKQHEPVDVVVAKPRTKGFSKGSLKAVIKLNPKRIVYISHNPETWLRDLKDFEAAGYHCSSVTPLDIAPQRPEMICVSAFTKD